MTLKIELATHYASDMPVVYCCITCLLVSLLHNLPPAVCISWDSWVTVCQLHGCCFITAALYWYLYL